MCNFFKYFFSWVSVVLSTELHIVFLSPLQNSNQAVQKNCNTAEYQYRQNYPVKFEYLASVNNQIAQAAFGGDKLPDYNSHQAEADVHLHKPYDIA